MLAGRAGAAEPEKPVEKWPNIRWGEAVRGLQAGIRLADERSEVRVGGWLNAVCALRNTSDQPIHFTVYHPLLWTPSLRTRDGKAVSVAPPWYDGPAQPQRHQLDPGRSVEFRFVECVVAPQKPIYSNRMEAWAEAGAGHYQASATVRLSRSPDTGDWEGELQAGAMPLEVLPADARDVAERVKTVLWASADAFTLKFVYLGDAKPPRPALRLMCNGLRGDYPAHWTTVEIARDQVEAILNHLAAMGYLARTVTEPRDDKRLAPPCYFLSISLGNTLDGGPNHVRDLPPLPLGWDASTDEAFQSLRKVLQGPAGKAMDEFLAKIEPERNRWKAVAKPADGPPAAGPPASLLDMQALHDGGLPEAAASNKKLIEALAGALRRHDQLAHLPTGVTLPMEAAIVELDGMRAGRETPFDRVEARAAELAKQFSTPEELGRIYAQVAHVYGQSGCPPKTIDWAQKALQQPLEPITRLRMQMYWGDATYLKHAKEIRAGAAASRRAALLAYLTGIEEATTYSLPDKAPELPVVEMVGNVDPPDPGLLEKHRKQVQARVVAEFAREMVFFRDVLIRQVAWQGLLGPASERERIETALKNPQAVARLVKEVKKSEDFAKAAEEILAGSQTRKGER
jgi:hypothetical protein